MAANDRYWDAFSAFAAVLERARVAGHVVPAAYGSPVYLGQYLQLHRAVDAEVTRLVGDTGRRARVLDWGAGNGHSAFVRSVLGDDAFAHCLADRGAAPYRDLLEYVTTQAAIELRTADHPVDLPFEDASLDVVMSCGVLEHVHEGGGDVRGSLDEIERVLRPGGAFICAHFPNDRSWIERLNRRLDRTHHDRTFSSVEVHSLGVGTQLDFVRTNTYGVVPRIQFAVLAAKAGVDTPVLGRALERFDRILSAGVGGVAQNHLLVMRKTGTDDERSSAIGSRRLPPTP